jgi:hypothetical protein
VAAQQHLETNMTKGIIPRDEPEIMWAKGRRHAAWCNDTGHEPYKDSFQALELAEKAYDAHGLRYEAGLGKLHEYPPDRFTWFCDETDATPCVKIRDHNTGRIVVWPHWCG